MEVSFDADSICRIIKVSAANRVTKIVLGSIEIFFDGHQCATFSNNDKARQEVLLEEERRIEEEKAIIQDELNIRDDQLAHMLVENPLEAEKMIEQGLLKEFTDGSGE